MTLGTYLDETNFDGIARQLGIFSSFVDPFPAQARTTSQVCMLSTSLSLLKLVCSVLGQVAKSYASETNVLKLSHQTIPLF